MEESTEHFQEDIVIQPRTLVTRYLHGQALCVRCNRPIVQAGEGELLNAPSGQSQIRGALFTLSDGDSYRKTAELFREVFGLTFVPASAWGSIGKRRHGVRPSMRICAPRSGPPAWSMPMKPHGAVTAWGILYGSQVMKTSPSFI